MLTTIRALQSCHLGGLLEEDLILVGDQVEESIAVNRKLVDDLVNHRLDLQLSKDATTNAIVEHFADHTAKLNV